MKTVKKCPVCHKIYEGRTNKWYKVSAYLLNEIRTRGVEVELTRCPTCAPRVTVTMISLN